MFLRVGDGYGGWPEKAPFDALIVTAAPERLPEPLLQQLAPAGRLVLPVGAGLVQNLEVWTRFAAGDSRRSCVRKELFGVRFVPLLGPHGQ